MKKALWFNPWNDIALARNVEAFTPPPAATSLARAGQLLPLWVAGEGDRVVCDGVNDAWLLNIKSRLDLPGEPWDHNPDNLSPTPWGWSRAARRYFRINGFDNRSLPDDAELELIRNLSHRRTAAEVARRLAERLDFDVWPAAKEIKSAEELASVLARGNFVVKAPWSSSGRGITFSTPETYRKVVQRVAGTIKSQGSVMVERAADRAIDFAMLFSADDDGCRYAGLSLFATGPGGEYRGNSVAKQEILEQRIVEAGIEAAHLQAVRHTLRDVLEEMTTGIYRGPIGVDMLVDRAGMLDPVVEINFRYTMGFVALALERHAAVDSIFSIVKGPVDDTAVITGGKLVEGTLALTPPGADFTFTLSAATDRQL